VAFIAFIVFVASLANAPSVYMLDTSDQPALLFGAYVGGPPMPVAIDHVLLAMSVDHRGFDGG
jgi:hypothetical protein